MNNAQIGYFGGIGQVDHLLKTRDECAVLYQCDAKLLTNLEVGARMGNLRESIICDLFALGQVQYSQCGTVLHCGSKGR